MTVADAVQLQKWILAKKDAKLANPDAADLNKDGIIDIFDLALLKQKLLQT